MTKNETDSLLEFGNKIGKLSLELKKKISEKYPGKTEEQLSAIVDDAMSGMIVGNADAELSPDMLFDYLKKQIDSGNCFRFVNEK